MVDQHLRRTGIIPNFVSVDGGYATPALKPIVSKPGLYEDPNVGISLAWPADVFTVEGKKKVNEVVRVLYPDQIPVLTLTIADPEI